LGQTGKFQESPGHLAFEFEPDQKRVSDQRGPDLDEHGIGRVVGFKMTHYQISGKIDFRELGLQGSKVGILEEIIEMSL
jgi:hypothetical protein